MKIESGRGVGQASGPRRAGQTAAPGFAPSADAPQRASAAAPTGPLTALDAVLALQGEEGPAQRRARQARRGRDALDALETLERGLLSGRAPAGVRAEMEALRDAAEPTGEAQLDAVLLEIDIRLAVELAKLERLPRA
ncbi:MAG: flagellar assembly protein FliX [Hyphomonadaceae bacterium]|nr:flagellar assembly protein FliX [Hyphomonadaceae bacterium]MBX3511235.1 flagellar assembly protein FliX [Hyphomonadaceae bacterium]